MRHRGIQVFMVLALASMLATPAARADVGVVLDEALPTGGDKISNTGHSAVYFSRICPETPVRLRLCHEGEHGSILSNYTGFGEMEPYEWNVAPLGVFLYGMEDPRRWPLAGSPKIKRVLEEHYREKYLSALCAQAPCTTSDKADWRYMAGAGLSRSLYIFVVETTVEQDRELIEKFNALPNENHFHAMTRNCADFTRSVIRTYFPNATHREVLNDFGMSSPKATARSFTRYAKQHPELNFHVLHFAQVPGTFKASKEARDGTEQLYHSPLFAVPLVLLAEYALPAAMVSYSVTGRFNPEREWEAHPSGREAELAAEMQAAKARNDQAAVKRLEAEQRAERDRVVGTDKAWKAYRAQWKALVVEAVVAELIPDRKSVGRIFDQIAEGSPYLDAGHGLWVEVSDGDHNARLGLTTSNILAPGSDPRLAYQLLLARAGRVLKSPRHAREPLVVFQRRWALLEAARKRNATLLASGKAAARQRAAENPAALPASADPGEED